MLVSGADAARCVRHKRALRCTDLHTSLRQCTMFVSWATCENTSSMLDMKRQLAMTQHFFGCCRPRAGATHCRQRCRARFKLWLPPSTHWSTSHPAFTSSSTSLAPCRRLRPRWSRSWQMTFCWHTRSWHSIPSCPKRVTWDNSFCKCLLSLRALVRWCWWWRTFKTERQRVCAKGWRSWQLSVALLSCLNQWRGTHSHASWLQRRFQEAPLGLVACPVSEPRGWRRLFCVRSLSVA
mmetsp:Transcript_53087/g.141935  ORF Transcript_53087/g.141935 Transcript_53087/m.141935 type:complete len:237 (+) Transcript_53087:482-1192(+)